MFNKYYNAVLIGLLALVALVSLSMTHGYGQPEIVDFVPLPPLTAAERVAHPSALELATWSNSHNFGDMHIFVAGMVCLVLGVVATVIHSRVLRRRRLHT